MIPFGEFLKQHQGLSREQFLARVRVPHVLLDRGRPTREASFLTVKLDKDALDRVERPGEEHLAPVEKRADGKNAFAMMITVGRAANNDIVIPDGRVSKFHAYFRQQGADWLICDANSRNGTFVDGQAVPQQGGAPVRPGARIRLAKSLELVFYDPPALFEKLRQAGARTS